MSSGRVRRSLAALFFGTAILLVVQEALGALSVEPIAAYNLVVDSNVESPSSYAPRSAYFGAKFRNDGATTLTNVFAYIGDAQNGTPGIYPRRSHSPLVGFAPDGKFALTHEGGRAGTTDATRYLGTIAPGESKTVYWLVSYPNLDATGKAVWGPSVKPDDDLWLNYDIWCTSGSGATAQTNSVRRKVTLRNEISAAANKIEPNTANQVPQKYKDILGQTYPTWQNTTVIIPGVSFLSQGFWYNLGNIGQGFDNNGDLVPDYNAWMQPVGDPNIFDPGCFRLIRTYALVIVKLKDGGEKVYNATDQLYFENVPENTDAVGWVGYEFLPLNGPCVAQLSPYQEVASGFDNEKFSSDFGTPLTQMITEAPNVSIDKTASVNSTVAGGRIDYSIAFTNSGVAAAGDPQLFSPLVVQDSVPSGTLYVANSAITNNTLPGGVTSYDVLFSTNNGTTWQNFEPVPATNVTDIQWWLSDSLLGATAGTVRFAVTVKSPYTLSSALINNTAGLSYGNGAQFTNDTATTLVTGTNVIGDTVFLDTGTGYGNGVQDVGESGISNVTVRLYSDSNTNGTWDATDGLVATTSTGPSGSYSFTNIIDGRFIVVVDLNDSDLPTGTTPTTSTNFAVSLDPTGTNVSSVSYLAADFGFAPALYLDKNLASAAPTYEGQTISYTIDVVNRLPGDGTGVGTNTFFTWGTNGINGSSGGSTWLNYTNAFIPPGPDGVYARPQFQGNNETMSVFAFTQSERPGSITNVQVAIPTTTNGLSMGTASITVRLYTNRSTAAIYTNKVFATNFGNGTYLIDVTSVRTWLWSDFANTNTTIELLADKGTGNPTGVVSVDAAGFRIMSTQTSGTGTTSTILDPVALSDTYDISRLQYVSATPSTTTISTNSNPGTLYWANIGPVYPGGTNRVTVSFKVLQPPNNTAALYTNTATTVNATFSNGRSAGTLTDSVVTNAQPSGSIGDTVWRDVNSNGVQDVGELGLANVSVTLSNSVSGVTVTNITDSTGYFLFTVLTNTGTYTIRVLTNTLPGVVSARTYDRDGTGTPDVATISTLNPTATDGSDTILNADFGYVLPSVFDGYLWRDVNCSGGSSPDLAEPYLTNITVLLYTNGVATAIATNTTDTNGYYRFSGSYNGNYTIVVTNTTGVLTNGTWSASYDADGIASASRVSTNIVTGGAVRASFAYCQTGTLSIGDTLFYDWNGDGIQTSGIDEGIPNITVYLYRDSNTNGVVEASSDALVGSTVTGVNGTFTFTSLPAGGYVVVVDEADAQFPPRYYETKDPDEAGVCTVCNGYGNGVVTTVSRTDVDFGYQPYGSGSIGDTVWFDKNGDGAQLGVAETNIPNIQLVLYVDMNSDGTYVAIATNSTGSSGTYSFSNLPDGNYRVVVNTNDTDLPSDVFSNRMQPSTATSVSATISNGSSSAGVDFGFTSYGAIGDTIYWDANANGTQDYNETGISNVTVNLYYDLNTNDVYDVGETLVATKVTATNGTYFFTNLVASNYVVVVSHTGPIASAALSADPSSDGIPCTATNAYMCDDQYGLTLLHGTRFTGADFGYQPPGVIGDLLWLDSNNNGVQDNGEPGIPNITIELRNLANALVATNVTDSDGNFVFLNQTNGTYRVNVLTNDSDFSSSLAATYDADGTNTPHTSTVTITGGSINLMQDFGYRYSGNNVVSGTIGLDDPTYDGVLGTNGSGTLSSETPFTNVTVYAYLWNDDGDSVVESGETIYVTSADSGTNGDYSLTGLPGGANGSSRYIISLSSPYDNLSLTTTTGVTPATKVVPGTNSLGELTTAYQVTTITALTTNIDFAFKWSVNLDFGDLPQTYSTVFQGTPDGARHIVAAVPTLYLGTGVTSESNGSPSTNANSDTFDDGVTITTNSWTDGAGGGSINVHVGAGSGWLVGWMDFDQNGLFDSTNELVASQAVSSQGTGSYPFSLAIPTNTISKTSTTTIYARFRLFSSEPNLAALAYSGEADSGEVEDYAFTFASIGNRVWEDTNGDGLQAGESGISNIVVFVDMNNNGTLDAGEPSATTDENGYWNIGGLPDGSYTVRVQTSSLPPGLNPTYDLDGVASASRTAVTITSGTSRTDLNFGYNYGPSGGTIGDFVWLDGNGNGLQDTNEVGISNVVVTLYLTNDITQTLTPVATNVTDAVGAYSFSGLSASNYVIGFTLFSNYVYTTYGAGTNNTIDSDVLTNGFTHPISVSGNQYYTNYDAGFYIPVTISCPSDVTVGCAGQVPAPNTNSVTVGGGCGGQLSVTFEGDSVGSSNCVNQFVVTRTYRVTDACGNTMTCQQSITVSDITAPAVTSNQGSDTTIECGTTPSFMAPVFTDICQGVISPSVNTVTNTFGTTNVITRTWTATDSCGNTTNRSQVITVIDTTAPMVTSNQGADTTIECGSTPNFTAPVFTDACQGMITPSVNTVTNTVGCSTEITRTWTATDAAGNTTNRSQVITIADTTAPAVTSNQGSDTTIECPATPSFTAPVFTDVCQGVISPSVNTVTNTFGTTNVITRTWTATDSCGNTTNRSQVITIADTTAPAVTSNQGSDTTIECPATPSFTAPVFTDVCQGVISPSVNTVTNTFGTTNVITRTWTATDSCGNTTNRSQVITVIDTTAPMVTSNQGADTTIECGSTPNFTAPVFTDACEGVITPSVNTVTNTVGCTTEITRTWTATDAAGNATNRSQVITIADTTAPAVTSSQGSDTTIECPETPSFTAPVFTDVCQGVISPSVNTITNPVGCSSVITRTWTATDSCGNTTNRSQTITVNDTTAPAVTSDQGADTTIGCADTPVFTAPVFTDACAGVITPSVVTVTNGTGCSSVITRTWTATDSCGNTTNRSQTITFSGNAIVSGHLYYDTNGNGTQNVGEPNITNVTVTVTSGTNVVTATTDASGNWSVSIAPGNVSADVDNADADFLAQVPTGSTQTEGSDPTVVNAPAGVTTNAGNDGYFTPSVIGSLVWNDLNNNGLVDAGEPGFDGITVELWQDLNDNNTYEPLGADAQTPLSTVTAGGGLYSFANLGPGKYFVVIPTPPAFHGLSSTHTVALDNQVDNDDNGVQTGGAETITVSPAITLSIAEVDNTVDFGFMDPGVGNLVWSDLNNNGVVDVGEPGIPGVVVELYSSANVKIMDTTTDSDGYYLFTGQAPNSYYVKIPASNFLPGGALENFPVSSSVVVTSDNQVDNDNNGSQASPRGLVTSPLIQLLENTEPIDATTETGRGSTLDNGTDGDADMTVDFGFVATYSIGNRVFADNGSGGGTAANGIQDGTEGGIANVGVRLYAADGGGNATGSALATTTTDASGYYRFDSVLAGTYVVVVDKTGSAALSGYVTSAGASSNFTLAGDGRDHGKDTALGAGSVLPGGIASPAVQVGVGLQPSAETVAAGSGANGPLGDGNDNLTVDFAFTSVHACAAGETTATWNVTGGNLNIILQNPWGLSSVVGLRFNNCTMTATSYGPGDVVLQNLVPLTQDVPLALAPGTVKVICIGYKINATKTSSANARAFDSCNSFSATIDPVDTTLEIDSSGRVVQTFTGLLSADQFAIVQNGTPGLSQLTIVMNEHTYVLFMTNGEFRTLDIAEAMVPGDENTVTLIGEGPEGASARVIIGDAPYSESVVVIPPLRLEIQRTALGIEVSWPDSDDALKLQSCSSLAPLEDWTDQPEVPARADGKFSVTLPNGAETRFFRLHKD